MDLSEHLTTIWRRRLQVVGAALVIAAIVYVFSGAQSKVFASDAVVRVQPATTETSVQQGNAVFLSRTYAKLAKTAPVLDEAAKVSGLPILGPTAGGRLEIIADEEVGFITVRATGPAPQDAQRLANALATTLIAAVEKQENDQLAERVGRLQNQLNDVQTALLSTPVGTPQQTALQAQFQALISQKTSIESENRNRIELVQQGDLRLSAVAPTPARNAVLALLIALVVNAELAVLLAALSDRLRIDDAEEVSRLTGLPVLARIPEEDGLATVEAFRTLRTNLMFLDGTVQLRSLAIVGPEPDSGKSYVAAGLAIAAASLELPVVLVDGDLRNPVQHKRLEVPGRPGLVELVRGTVVDVDQVLQRYNAEPNLRVLPAGAPVDDPAGLLSGSMSHVIAELSWADLVVVDTPAARLYAEGPAIAAQCDATLVVLSSDNARRRAVREFVADLRRIGARPVGVVLNRVAVDVGALERYTRADRHPGGSASRIRASTGPAD